MPILSLKKPDRTRWDDRKLDHVRPYLDKAEAEGRTGVVAIVAGPGVPVGLQREEPLEHARGGELRLRKEERRVGIYYFYILDRDFGPGFIKICTYFPYPAKVWLNGHEWAKRQARTPDISPSPNSRTASPSCEDPAASKPSATASGLADIQGFFDRWTLAIPTPFTDDRPPGRLLLGAVDAPGRGLPHPRLRRPAPGPELLRVPRPRQRRHRPALRRCRPSSSRQVRKTTKEPFRTRIFSPGTEVKMDFAYKHSRVKQYLKEGRALRIETVINKPSDIGILARIEHLPELVEKARQVNERLLRIERAGQGCAIGSALFERIHQPYTWEGQRTGAFRFGDQRAMALTGALCYRRPRRHRLQQQEPSRACRRTPRPRLLEPSDDL